jgi:glutaminyl-tRNA synthetase
VTETTATEPAPGTAVEGAAPGTDFLRAIVIADRKAGKHGGRVHTRFPPEPNGYLHIGHAKSIHVNFGIAAEFGGLCNLRFDDTNPETEDPEFVQSIQDDVRWLGYDWDDRLYFASGYFERLYELAEGLIEDGKAYVDSLSEEEIRAHRGTVTEPGRPSPWRDRTAEESLDLFRRMRAGEFPDGAHVLRARIDLAAANMKMRDPLLYRIRHARHYRTGDEWCIYPMYDWAHPLSDAIEDITHSFCTLEFENNREIYDWAVRESRIETSPRQIEFARLNLSYTVLSKRKLAQLVEGGHVAGWDDPRMPTLAGLRRRGYTPESIRAFCHRIGIAKANSTVDMAMLEHSVRDDLNARAPRVLCVLRPLKVTITNYPEGPEDRDRCEELDAPYWPHDVPREGSRKLPFGRTILIERDDFAEEPPPGFRRLAPGREVRLRYAYFISCHDIVRNDAGEVVELLCTYDPATRGGAAPDGRNPAGTLHWVSAEHALPVEVRLYDRLFTVEKPGETKGADFLAHLDPASLEALSGARVEPAVAGAEPGSRFQFERLGYFYLDPEDSTAGRTVFNRIVPLRDAWARKADPARPAAQRTAEPAAGRQPAAPPPEPEPTPELLRYRDALGLPPSAAATLAADPALARFYERALAAAAGRGLDDPAGVAAWVVNDLQRERKERGLADPAELPVDPAGVAELAALVDSGTLTATAAREVFAELAARGGSAREIVERRGLERVADRDALAALTDRVLAENPEEAERYRAGKTSLLGFFIGRVMEASGGIADPKVVRELLRERLG